MVGGWRLLWGLGIVGCLGPNPAFDVPRETEGASGSGSATVSSGATTTMLQTASTVDPTSESSGGPPDMSCDASDPDLVLCLDFESNAGDVLLDGSMYGHDATASGTTLVSSPWGRAIVSGAATRIEVPCFVECEASDGLTLEARVRIDELPAAAQRVGIVDNDLEYAITYSHLSGLRCSTGGSQLIGPELTQGEWVYVACTYDGADIRAYVDGIEVATVAANNPVGSGDTDPMAVANTAPNWNEPFIGALDRLRVWRRARSPAEICDEAGC